MLWQLFRWLVCYTPIYIYIYIRTSSRLVKDEDARVAEQLRSNGQALPLTAGDARVVARRAPVANDAPNQRIGTFPQSHLSDGGSDHLVYRLLVCV